MATNGNIRSFGPKPDTFFTFPKDNGATVSGMKMFLVNYSGLFRSTYSRIRSDDIPLTITTCSFDMFCIMMEHIHGGATLSICRENFLAILEISQDFSVNSLTFVVIKFIKEFINANNVHLYFEALEEFNINMIREHIVSLCQESPVQIIRSLSTSPAHKRLLRIILESSDLACSEIELYQAVLLMLQMVQNQEMCCGEGLRKLLGNDLLHLIRFPTMTVQELILCGKQPCLLTPTELVNCLLWVQEEIFTGTMLAFSTKMRNRKT